MMKSFTNPVRKGKYLFLALLVPALSVPMQAEPPIQSFMEAAQQTVTVKGIVNDETGNPIPGASVSVKGTTVGTIADIDGKFQLSYSFKSDDMLVVSFIGMRTVEEKVGDRRHFEFTLHEDATDLDEVVVVGYGNRLSKI